MRTLSIFLIGVAGFFPAIAQPNSPAAVHPGSPVISEETVFSFYKSFKRLTPAPIDISSAYFYWGRPECSFSRCEKQKQREEQEERERAGPHKDTLINFYVNELAENAITQKLATFPTSAIIVMEELESVDNPATYPKITRMPAVKPFITSVYGMIKRESGFATQNGDWEYFYAGKLREFSNAGEFAKGQLESCIACHAKAKDADYVFKVRNPDKALREPIEFRIQKMMRYLQKMQNSDSNNFP